LDARKTSRIEHFGAAFASLEKIFSTFLKETLRVFFRKFVEWAWEKFAK